MKPHSKLRYALPRCLLLLAVALTSSAWGQPGAGSRAPADPAAECYRIAATGDRDVYPCDLAVQVARDSGSPRDLAAAHANRAMVLARLGRWPAALQDLDIAVQAAPTDADAHGNRGNVLLRLGRPAEALAAHERAVALAPGDPTSYYNRAFSLQALGDFAAADADVAQARELLAGAARPAAGAGGQLRGADTRAPGGARGR
ncbi:MAG: tetratricopeptide repeat protein [Pseudomonadales bacterium]